MDYIYIEVVATNATTSGHEFSNLLSIVIKLQHKVSTLETDVSTLRTENNDLSKILNLILDNGTKSYGTDAVTQTPTEPNGKAVNQAKPVSSTDTSSSSSDTSSSSDQSGYDSTSSDDCGFQLPNTYLRKLRKLERKMSRITTKNGTTSSFGPSTRKQTVNRQPDRQPGSSTRKQTQQPQKKPAPLVNLQVGTRGETDHATAPTSSHKGHDLYIGGVSASYTTHDITRSLQEAGINHVSNVSSLFKGDNWQSFRATLTTDGIHRAIKEISWPNGVVVRPFRVKYGKPSRPRRDPSHQSHHRDQPRRYNNIYPARPSNDRKSQHKQYPRHTRHVDNRDSHDEPRYSHQTKRYNDFDEPRRDSRQTRRYNDYDEPRYSRHEERNVNHRSGRYGQASRGSTSNSYDSRRY